MVNFVLSGLNANVAQTSTNALTTVTAATETESIGPVLNLTIPAAEWNKVFSIGDNIYHTYSGVLPTLDNNSDSTTLATKNLTDPGTGAAEDEEDGVKLQEPEETAQTIADDCIRAFIFKITDTRGQQGLYSNIADLNTEIDTLLTSTAGTPAADSTTLINKLKWSILSANGLTDSTTTVANLSRQLKLLCLASDSSRLTADSATDMYHANNILSNLVGDLSGVSGSTSYTDGTYTQGTSNIDIAVSSANGTASGTGTSAAISTITIRDNKVVGVTFSNVGSGYKVGNILTISTNILAGSGDKVAMANTYTLVAGDLDNAGGFTNKLFNFLFEANDTLSFQLTITPHTTPTQPVAKVYNIKITMS